MSNLKKQSFEDSDEDLSPKNKNQTKLNAPESEIDPKEDEAIQAALEDRRKYINRECMYATKSLDFGSSDINDLDAVTISMYLVEQHTNLRILHLGSNQIEDEGLIDILSGLQLHTNLRELYIGNNPFSSLGINALIDTLPLFEKLEILSLSNLGITDDLAVLFFNSITELPNLNTLLLNANEIGDDGFVILSVIISSKQIPWRILHLGETIPTTQGLLPFFKSLHANNSLKQLYLNDINMDNEAISSLNKMLAKNKALEQINLGNCGIDDEGISILSEALTRNLTLQHLHLWRNKITDEGAQTLLEVLQEQNDTLTALTLANNPIKNDNILDEIQELIKQNISFYNVNIREQEPLKEKKEDNEAYEDDFEDDSDGDDRVDVEDNKENKITEQKDEEELQEIEKEISNAEKEIEEEKLQRRALKEKEQSKINEKIWKGFAKKGDGLLHSEFIQK